MQHPKWFNTSPTSKLFIMILTVVVGTDAIVTSPGCQPVRVHLFVTLFGNAADFQHDQFRYQVEQNNSPSIHHIPQKQLIKSNNNTSTGKSMLIK
uniref:Secreted protein n=1 Tax=Glossina palpalis gambiensis TaxID=67801 RepID=A0A1B0BD14_9MUSC